MTNNEETLMNMPTEVKEVIYGEGFNSSSENKFNFAIINKTENGLTYEELWILSNAYYDYTAQRFVKIDATNTSFAIQIQANGTYPGEAELGYENNTGINIWRNPSKADVASAFPGWASNEYYDFSDFMGEDSYIGVTRRSDDVWQEFGVYAGWNNNFMIDSYGGLTIGGAGFEVDGNGIFPYTRVTNSSYLKPVRDANNDLVYDANNNLVTEPVYLLGLLDNAYHPTQSGWDSDKNDTWCWFFGLETPSELDENDLPVYLKKDNTKTKFVIMYNDTPFNSNSIHELDVTRWKTVFEADINSVKGLINGNLLDLGDYTSLKNKPTIPSNVSDLNNDSGFLTEHQSLSNCVTTNDSRLSDSGWLELTVNSNFYNYTENSAAVLPLQYRKVGSLVQIIGLIGLNANLAVGQWTIGILPEGYRPSREMSFVCELNNNSNLWTCIVKTTGEITFNRLRDDTGFIAGTQWVDTLKLNVMFLK